MGYYIKHQMNIIVLTTCTVALIQYQLCLLSTHEKYACTHSITIIVCNTMSIETYQDDDNYYVFVVVFQDIDECVRDTHTCNRSLATCTNTQGNFDCSCITGFTGDGVEDNCSGKDFLFVQPHCAYLRTWALLMYIKTIFSIHS